MLMTEPQEVIPEIDRLIHEPARLAILTVLAACERADFLFLERATGLTRGNLSVQLTRLEEGGLIEIEKVIVGRRTLTTAVLVYRGRQAFDSYWKSMDAMRARSINGQKTSTRPAGGLNGSPATAAG
jgi:DNA-binding transcriptional ArsR family regulator